MSHILTISNLQSGGLITNYYCTSSCRHCLYRCSPLWPKKYINKEQTYKNLSIIKQLGCNSFHIGGGEPLLNVDGLIEVLKIAKELDVIVEYIETNSSWFNQVENACDILNELANYGVTSLLVSISPFHNEFIPFYKVRGVLNSCKKTGMPVNAWTFEFFNEIDNLDHFKPHTLDEFELHYGENYISEIPQRYWISHGGRALDTFSKINYGKALPALLAEHNCGCKELESTSHFHIDLFGNYIPGLCAGLSIMAEDIGNTIDPAKYPLITMLHTMGIRNFFRYAMDNFGFESSKAIYFSKCELCYEIRKYLVCSAGIRSHELEPVEHYTLPQNTKCH
jgi:hypothetical protein